MTTQRRDDDLAALRAALVGMGNVEEIAEILLGPRNRALSTGRTWRWGNHGSVAVEVRGRKRGIWFDHEGGQGGDLLALIMRERACLFTAAVTAARDLLGMSPAELDSIRPANRFANDDAKDAAEARCKIGDARLVWDASVPLAGSLAETYLTGARAIPMPAAGWPNVLRFHSASRSLIGAATGATGDVRAVQRVRLTAAGCKDANPTIAKGAPPGVSKPTNGRLAGTVMRLPGDPAGPLLIAEGIETGLSVWRATEHETWIVLGALANLVPPDGRRVVLCRDDDKDRSPADRTLRRTVAAWREAGATIRIATPWPERRGDKSDFNDLLQVHGPAAVRQRIEAALSGPGPYAGLRRLPAYYPAPTEPRDEALARQERVIHAAISNGAVSAGVLRGIASMRATEISDDDDDTMTPAQKSAITRRIRRSALANFGLAKLPPASRDLVTGALAAGKTTIAIKAIAEIRGDGVIWATQPSIQKAEEVLADYRKVAGSGSLQAMVVYGRGQPDRKRPGKAMCVRHVVAHKAAEKGVNVRKAICAKCRFKPDCGTMRQDREIDAMNGRGLFLMARDYLFLPSQAPKPDILIVDEAVTMTALPQQPLSLPPDIVRQALRYKGGTNLAAHIAAGKTLNRLVEAIQTPAPLAALREAGVTVDALRQAAKLIEAGLVDVDAGIDGTMTDEAIELQLDKLVSDDARRTLLLLTAVIREMRTVGAAPAARDTLTGVTFDPQAEVQVGDRGGGPCRTERLPRITVHRLKPIQHIRRGTTLLLLDGTGSPLLNQKLFGKLRHHRIAIERDAHVIGTVGKSYSRQSLTGCDRHGEPIAAKQDAAARLQGEVARIAARMPSPLVVANKSVADALKAVLPKSLSLAHFGKVRGINQWQECQSGLVVGRESISIAALETMARAFFADDPEPFISFDHPAPPGWPWPFWPYRQTRGRRMRDGTVQPVEVEVHPDPRCQEILEQIREAEIIQAGDRTRPIFNHRKLVFMDNLVLDLTYDRVLTHAELVAGGSRWDMAWAATGIIPLGGPDLHLAHPTLFDTEDAARRALQKRDAITAPSSNRYSIWGKGSYRYRRIGQRGRDSEALIDISRHPRPAAALAEILGPLAWCRPTSDPPSPPSEPARDTAPHLPLPSWWEWCGSEFEMVA